VLLQAAVALAGDDDGRVWWPAVAQHESDQLATHGSGEEEEARVRVRVRHVWRGAGRGNCVRWPAGTTRSNLKDAAGPSRGGARLCCRPAGQRAAAYVRAGRGAAKAEDCLNV
jgi:hypothetical protein